MTVQISKTKYKKWIVFFRMEGNRLIHEYDAEQLWIDAWGENSFRVRATQSSSMQSEDWALLPQEACEVLILTHTK